MPDCWNQDRWDHHNEVTVASWWHNMSLSKGPILTKWRQLVRVGHKLSLKKMRGRRESRWESEGCQTFSEAEMASLHCIWRQLSSIFDVKPLKHVGLMEIKPSGRCLGIKQHQNCLREIGLRRMCLNKMCGWTNPILGQQIVPECIGVNE